MSWKWFAENENDTLSRFIYKKVLCHLEPQDAAENEGGGHDDELKEAGGALPIACRLFFVTTYKHLHPIRQAIDPWILFYRAIFVPQNNFWINLKTFLDSDLDLDLDLDFLDLHSDCSLCKFKKIK